MIAAIRIQRWHLVVFTDRGEIIEACPVRGYGWVVVKKLFRIDYHSLQEKVVVTKLSQEMAVATAYNLAR